MADETTTNPQETSQEALRLLELEIDEAINIQYQDTYKAHVEALKQRSADYENMDDLSADEIRDLHFIQERMATIANAKAEIDSWQPEALQKQRTDIEAQRSRPLFRLFANILSTPLFWQHSRFSALGVISVFMIGIAYLVFSGLIAASIATPFISIPILGLTIAVAAAAYIGLAYREVYLARKAVGATRRDLKEVTGKLEAVQQGTKNVEVQTDRNNLYIAHRQQLTTAIKKLLSDTEKRKQATNESTRSNRADEVSQQLTSSQDYDASDLDSDLGSDLGSDSESEKSLSSDSNLSVQTDSSVDSARSSDIEEDPANIQLKESIKAMLANLSDGKPLTRKELVKGENSDEALSSNVLEYQGSSRKTPVPEWIKNKAQEVEDDEKIKENKIPKRPPNFPPPPPPPPKTTGTGPQRK